MWSLIFEALGKKGPQTVDISKVKGHAKRRHTAVLDAMDEVIKGKSWNQLLQLCDSASWFLRLGFALVMSRDDEAAPAANGLIFRIHFADLGMYLGGSLGGQRKQQTSNQTAPTG